VQEEKKDMVTEKRHTPTITRAQSKGRRGGLGQPKETNRQQKDTFPALGGGKKREEEMYRKGDSLPKS